MKRPGYKAKRRAAAEGRPVMPVTMFFRHGGDQRRYNEPLHDEIAVVFVGEDGAPPGFGDCDIIVHPFLTVHVNRSPFGVLTVTQW